MLDILNAEISKERILQSHDDEKEVDKDPQKMQKKGFMLHSIHPRWQEN